MALLDDTLALAKNTPLDMSEVCRAVGVTLRWYQMVQAGDIAEPSVVKIQRLHDYLKRHGKKRPTAA